MSQRQTVPSTNSGTSEKGSPKKEHWKSKQKRERLEAQAKHPGKGNADFLLTPELEEKAIEEFNQLADHAEHIPENVPQGTMAVGAITQADRDIDQMLENIAKRNPIQDLGPEQVLVVEKKKRDTLRNHVENYQPATTLTELQEQVHLAQMNEIDSIEASPALVRHLWKKDFDYIKVNTGYGIYHNIRVYIDGYYEQNKGADSVSMEQRLHGKGSKVDTVPIITPQRI